MDDIPISAPKKPRKRSVAKGREGILSPRNSSDGIESSQTVPDVQLHNIKKEAKKESKKESRKEKRDKKLSKSEAKKKEEKKEKQLIEKKDEKKEEVEEVISPRKKGNRLSRSSLGRSARRASRSVSLKEISQMFKTQSSNSKKEEKKGEKPEIRILATNHVKHVEQEGANEFLMGMLNLRDEKYAHIHHEIRAGMNKGYILLRPSANMANQFRSMINSEPLRKVRRF